MTSGALIVTGVYDRAVIGRRQDLDKCCDTTGRQLDRVRVNNHSRQHNDLYEHAHTHNTPDDLRTHTHTHTHISTTRLHRRAAQYPQHAILSHRWKEIGEETEIKKTKNMKGELGKKEDECKVKKDDAIMTKA